MNKIGKAMLCTVLTGAMAVGAAGAADLGSLSPQGAKAYLNQITTLQNKYGKAAARTDDGFKGLLTGLSMAKLVDMDGDKIPELYCGAGLAGQHMYSYADGKIYALNIPESVSNFATDVSPCADFYVDDTKAYLVDGHEKMNGFPVRYLTKQGRKIVTALTYTDAIDDDTGNHICTLNGESVTYHELSAAQVAFTKGMTWEHYSFWESPYNVPEVRSVRASLTDTHHFPSHAHRSDCICFQAQGRAQRCKDQSCSLYHQRQQLFQAARPRRCPQGSGQRVCGNMERRPAAHRPDEQDRIHAGRRRTGCPARRQ